jgi:prevent-host-death family protein
MTQISVRQARENLARLIESASAGQTIAITKRGKTVAVLGPPAEVESVPLPDMAGFHRKLGEPRKNYRKLVVRARESERY